MRCLTMAREITARGGKCTFICRDHSGNLIEAVRANGFAVHVLPVEAESDDTLAHSQWLGSTQARDALSCIEALHRLNADWVVVDHYALDEQWESAVSVVVKKLFVIDDLTDRVHRCALLLNQNLDINAQSYESLLPEATRILCGPNFALLRPEFFGARQGSLAARQGRPFERILVSLGGVDKDNVTLRVVNAIKTLGADHLLKLTVVMGPSAPWVNGIRAALKDYPGEYELLVGVNNMAELMAASDVAIGAAGSTSWERCVLGLPTLVVVLADNQRPIGLALQTKGAARIIELETLESELPKHIIQLFEPGGGREFMSHSAAQVCDGQGVQRVVDHMYE
ncbi:UDP-2,4-diacetamido-2,4,6-trideoxy-beta-L-altropyranose hydrolase [Pseudomonas alkylphenolica]|uniref:UDP-2,4-diacetamido-2,4, 6-trideoxy-beta-L-altropyranose hydrolase n=1 Tax=Pseudomonas alkylphenolica TaxID=237609 RepID=UPI003390B3B2